MSDNEDLLSSDWLDALDTHIKAQQLDIGLATRALRIDPLKVFVEADLRGADFARQNLFGFNFHYADLAGADLRDARFEDCRFDFANFAGALLEGAVFERSSFFGAVASPKPWLNEERPLSARDTLDAFQGGYPQVQLDEASGAALRVLVEDVWEQLCWNLRNQSAFVTSVLSEEIARLDRIRWDGQLSRDALASDVAQTKIFLSESAALLSLQEEPAVVAAMGDLRRIERGVGYFRRLKGVSRQRLAEQAAEVEGSLGQLSQAFIDLEAAKPFGRSPEDMSLIALARLRHVACALLLSGQFPDYAEVSPLRRGQLFEALARLVRWTRDGVERGVLG